MHKTQVTCAKNAKIQISKFLSEIQESSSVPYFIFFATENDQKSPKAILEIKCFKGC